MKKVCIQVGHWNIENITSSNLRSWRSATYLKRSTGASGERNWHWNEWMPRLRDKLIAAGVQVYVVDAIYHNAVYNQEYDLWISGHYDGGGDSERCMISAPNRATQPAYLNSGAFTKSEEFCNIWKQVYPSKVNQPNRDDKITAGMKDYYAFDYVGYDTPSVIVEHFNHTASGGQSLKNSPDLVAEADCQAILRFLGIEGGQGKDYVVTYKNNAIHSLDYDPVAKNKELIEEISKQEQALNTLKASVGDLQKQLEQLNVDYEEISVRLKEVLKESQDFFNQLKKVTEENEDLKKKLKECEAKSSASCSIAKFSKIQALMYALFGVK